MFNLSVYIVINICKIIVVSDCISLYKIIVNVKEQKGEADEHKTAEQHKGQLYH